MDYENCCWVCGKYGVEYHHAIRRGSVKALIHCKLNLYPLCPLHHRSSPQGIHGGNKELDLKLKLDFQNKLEMLFDKEYLTEDEINSVLEIGPTALKKLLKPLRRKSEGYYFLDVIKACCGGRLYGDS